MKHRIWKLVVLSLSASIVPPAWAQGSRQTAHDDRSQPRAELVTWSQAQKPEPVPSPRPVPLPDQQPEQRPDAQQPPSETHGDAHTPNAKQTFAGTITKSGKKYVLNTADKITYQLDDQARAKKYEGKQVQVTGNLDEKSGMIHVQDIKAA